MTRYQSDLPLHDAALARLDDVLAQVSQHEHDNAFDNAFDSAAKLLHKTLLDDGDLLPERTVLELSQRRALCTSKNNELPPEQRFQQALKILQKADPLDDSEDPETLGQAGGIYKRQWYETADRRNLEQALAYYRRGAETGSGEQCWTSGAAYCAINLAFLLDVYAAQLDPAALQIPELPGQQADHWRKNIIQQAPALVSTQAGSELWWTMVTVAEAWFGWGYFEQAAYWLDKARKQKQQPPWKLETMLRQLLELARLKWADQPDRLQQSQAVLSGFIQNDQALASITEGRFGLALSGGGFRASFYHIGVLARLAELDLLRKVEVISCVSGGSIVGALYYLELQQLLETTADQAISREDYITLVQRLEQHFLAGVQTGIRGAMFWQSWKLLKPGYSRTHLLADLYEQRLYQTVPSAEGLAKRSMADLIIRPAETKHFKLKDDNWSRHNKVPMLVINATTLNTGHSWQFTASWMGEAPWAVDTEIDANTRLNWLYYSEATAPEYKNMRLGHAVAASSCVPGLFKPLAITGLYNGFTPQLVDGGIYDNQGTAALLDKGCAHILVSDASGQLATDDASSSLEPKVVLRTNEIFQERMRTLQQKGLRHRHDSGALKSICHLHLRKDLHSPLLSPGAEPVHDTSSNRPQAEYGIHRDYQHAIAAIRTDLDSFSDNEARALMCSGYRMVECYLPQSIRTLGQTDGSRQQWGFSPLLAKLGSDIVDGSLLSELRTARRRLRVRS